MRVETVPREVTKTDYYAVEHVKTYKPQIVPERYLEVVPKPIQVRKT